RFNKLNLTPCVTIYWNKDKILGKGISDKFLEFLDNKYTVEIKINLNRPLIDVEDVYYEPSDITYTRSITLLSSWTYSVPKVISNDFLIIEETLNYKHGNLTILRPLDS